MYDEGVFQNDPQVLVLLDGNLKAGQQEVIVTVGEP